jgi:hypothetical protein
MGVITHVKREWVCTKKTAITVVMQDFSGIMAHRKFPFHLTATANFTGD